MPKTQIKRTPQSFGTTVRRLEKSRGMSTAEAQDQARFMLPKERAMNKRRKKK